MGKLLTELGRKIDHAAPPGIPSPWTEGAAAAESALISGRDALNGTVGGRVCQGRRAKISITLL